MEGTLLLRTGCEGFILLQVFVSHEEKSNTTSEKILFVSFSFLTRDFLEK